MTLIIAGAILAAGAAYLSIAVALARRERRETEALRRYVREVQQ